MYDFRSKTPPPVYHGRAYQRRLIYLVIGFGLVLYAMWQARDPRHWKWFEALTQPRVAEIDTAAPADLPRHDDAEPLLATPRPRAEKPDASRPLPERVRPELMKAVVDNVAGLDPKELDAHFHLLEVLREADDEAIRIAKAEPVTHLQLWEQSAAYRGKLVSMTGSIMRAVPGKFPPNDYGLRDYYEVWMVPDGASNPVVIYALELPDGFPQGRKVNDEPGTVRGFYYRRWWYLAGDDKQPDSVKGRLAPMMLARSIGWSPRPAADARSEVASFETLCWALGVGAVVVALGVLFLRRYVRDESPDYVHARRKPGHLGDIPDADKPDLAADLKKLSEAEGESERYA